MSSATCAAGPSPDTGHLTSYTSRPTPCTLHATPCTQHATPCTQHATPCSLHATPCTQHTTHYALCPYPGTVNAGGALHHLRHARRDEPGLLGGAAAASPHALACRGCARQGAAAMRPALHTNSVGCVVVVVVHARVARFFHLFRSTCNLSFALSPCPPRPSLPPSRPPSVPPSSLSPPTSAGPR